MAVSYIAVQYHVPRYTKENENSCEKENNLLVRVCCSNKDGAYFGSWFSDLVESSRS